MEMLPASVKPAPIIFSVGTRHPVGCRSFSRPADRLTIKYSFRVAHDVVRTEFLYIIRATDKF